MDLLYENRSLITKVKLQREADDGSDRSEGTDFFALLFDNYREFPQLILY